MNSVVTCFWVPTQIKNKIKINKYIAGRNQKNNRRLERSENGQKN